MAGICRGSANSKSIILDSGMGSNIEKFCVRRGVKLIGVCPEDCISYPKILKKQKDELANGHTHFVLIGNKEDKSKQVRRFAWGDESPLKYDLARRIAAGRQQVGNTFQSAPPCRIVTVLLGDNEQQAIKDLETSINFKIPVIALEGSPLSKELIDYHDEFVSSGRVETT